MLAVRRFGLTHRCELMFTTASVLDGLTQVKLVAGKGHRKVGIRLESRTHLSWIKVGVITWHSGKLARVARSFRAAEMHAAADAEGELTYIRLSLWEIFRGTAPLKNWQECAAKVSATMVLRSIRCIGTQREEAQKPVESLKRKIWRCRLVYDP